ncbi:IclR family transcriptional regulator (plasmid) [Photobacterium sp. GJ3]|uniref:IclR family transcriptional regulator n=1 Tax=Photobacterium sp. GJ3 TaxID=2829502 RepID=UPI001B8D3E22|nr:IclR family transcriptional regulator [Photobacterium sp. GJ3]QUJ69998.1 IclR family transcriptional regulator [Photobacterium sp. GJ3]
MTTNKPAARKEKGSTIERVLQILSFISEHEGQYDQHELAEAMDLPKLAIGKLVAQLKTLGILRENMLRKIIAGPEFRQMALAVLRNKVFASQRTAVLEKLSAQIGETCGVSVPNGIEMLYFERVQTNWPLQINLPVGSSVPLAATASGKLYLATLPDHVRQVILDNIALEVFTAHTLVEKAQLEQELKTVRALGYGRDNGEFIDGMAAVSVPIARDGLTLGYLFCHSPMVRQSLMDLESHLPAMREAAEEMMDLMLTDG